MLLIIPNSLGTIIQGSTTDVVLFCSCTRIPVCLKMDKALSSFLSVKEMQKHCFKLCFTLFLCVCKTHIKPSGFVLLLLSNEHNTMYSKCFVKDHPLFIHEDIVEFQW